MAVLSGDHVAGSAGRGVHDRPWVAHQGVDQAALAHVGAARHHDLPRFDQVPAEGSAGQQGGDLLAGHRPLPLSDRLANRLNRPAQCPMDTGLRGWRRSARCGPGSRPPGRRRPADRSPWSMRATACQASGRQPEPTRACRIMSTVAWPPWQCNFDRLVRAAADDDFLAGVIAEAADGQPVVAHRLESSAAGRAKCAVATACKAPGPSTSRVATAPRPGGVSRIDSGKVRLGHDDILTRPAA